MVKAHDIVKRPVTEDEFCTFIEAALETFHWRWVHFRPARTQKGWRTAITGHKGLPDYIAVRPPRLLFIEAKGTTGVLEPDQKAWLADLDECAAYTGKLNLKRPFGIETHVWWPRDHEIVLEVLR